MGTRYPNVRDMHANTQLLLLLLLLLQETDDEDEESCYIKERLRAFLHWLQGLDWFQRLQNKRQRAPNGFKPGCRHISGRVSIAPPVCF